MIKRIHNLRSPEPETKIQAANQVGESKDRLAVDALIKQLNDPSAKVQAAAAEALGQIKDWRAVSALINSFEGKTYSATFSEGEGTPGKYTMIVESAAIALGKIGTKQAVDALLLQMNEHKRINVERTAAAAVGLGYTHDKRALPILLQMLKNNEQFIRSCAAEALGQYGSAEAIGALVNALQDGSNNVQCAAAIALGDLKNTRAAQPLHDVIKNIELYIPESSTEQYNESKRLELKAILREARIRLLSKAARGLALIGDETSIAVLNLNFHSPDQDKQMIAAIGLAYRKNQEVFDILAKALQDKNTAIQLEAIDGLIQLGDKKTINALQEITLRRDIPIRVIDAAKQALVQINPPEQKPMPETWNLNHDT